MRIKEGESVIVSNKGTYQVGMVVGKVISNKRVLYDILLENRSLIPAVPSGDTTKKIHIDINLTERIIRSSDKFKVNLPKLTHMVESDTLPSYR